MNVSVTTVFLNGSWLTRDLCRTLKPLRWSQFGKPKEIPCNAILKRSATKYRTLKIYFSVVSGMNIINLVNFIEYLGNCTILGLSLLVISVTMGTKTLMASFCIWLSKDDDLSNHKPLKEFDRIVFLATLFFFLHRAPIEYEIWCCVFPF